MRRHVAVRAPKSISARTLTPTLIAALLALAGCGSSSTSSSTTESSPPAAATPTTSSSAATSTPAAAPTSTASSSLTLAADPEGQLKFDKTSLTAKAGAVSIAFTNSSSVPHNVTVESSSGATVGATPTFSGGSKSVSLNLKAGTYKFYCSIPGHRQAGMEGTITVN
jgi:plastocyanin